MMRSLNWKNLLMWIGLMSVLLSAASSPGAVIYSNLGPGDSFQDGNGYLIEGPDRDWLEQSIASPFKTGPFMWSFAAADLGLGLQAGGDSFEVRVMADADGLPGRVLHALPFSGVSQASSLVTIESDGSLALDADTTYWIGVFAKNDSRCAWLWNDTAAGGRAAQRHDLANWEGGSLPEGAMRIYGTVVPEPSTITLATAGLAVLLVARRARSNDRPAKLISE